MATITGTVLQTTPISTQSVSGNVLHYRATAAQTFAKLSQAGAGSGAFFSLQETAVGSDSMLVFFDELLEDLVLASDTYSSIDSQFLTDAALADGTPTFDVVINEAHTAIAFGDLLSSIQTTTHSRERIVASEELVGTAIWHLVETAVATSDFPLLDISLGLQSTAYASSSLVTTGILNQTLSSSAWASGDSEYALAELLTSTGTAEDTLAGYSLASQLITATATGSDVQTELRSSFAELLSAGNASSLIILEGSTLKNELSDTAIVSEFLIYQDPAALAWVLNPETAGLSYFDNFGFHSIAEYKGVLYATSNFGLYAVNADTDEGSDISAQIKTGFLDLDSPQTKRISDVFIGYTGGQLEFDVETYDGPQEVYTYQLEERDADAPRNNRLKVGRGLSSRYWRFAIRNTEGADFQLYDVTAEVASSKRRL